MSRIVVTGANRGIGLELTRQLAARGNGVVAACRQASPALKELGVSICENLDVADAGSVATFAEGLGSAPIDTLINNAGMFTRETLEDLDWDRIRRQFEVNTLGPLRVTKALLPRLKAGSKVAIVSSRVGSIADNTSGGNYGYRISKTAVNAAGMNLAHDLKPLGIAVILLHPGYVRTKMTGGKGQVEAAEAAAGLIARIDALTLAETGSFRHASGEALPW